MDLLLFTVAARLGRTVEELRHSISERELRQWSIFLDQESNPGQDPQSLSNALIEMGAERRPHGQE